MVGKAVEAPHSQGGLPNGLCADSRTPLTGADRQCEPLSITGAPSNGKKAEGPQGAPWRASGYPHNSGHHSGYQVAYDGQFRSPAAPATVDDAAVCLLYASVLHGPRDLVLLQIHLQELEDMRFCSVQPSLSKHCKVSQGEECKAYSFPSFFSESLVRLVDASPEKNTFFFRSPMPLSTGGETLTEKGLLKAMKHQAELGGLVFPKEIRLQIYSLVWDGYNSSLNEHCELNREFCLLEENDSLLAAVQQWPLYGESVNPYDVPEKASERLALAKDMPRWCGDFVDQRVDHLYAQLHLGVAAGETARAAAAAAAAAVSLSPVAAAAGLADAAHPHSHQPPAAAAAANIAGGIAPRRLAKYAASSCCGGACGAKSRCGKQQQQEQQRQEAAAAAGETAEDTPHQQSLRKGRGCGGCGGAAEQQQPQLLQQQQEQQDTGVAAAKENSKKHRRKHPKHDHKVQQQQQHRPEARQKHKHHAEQLEPRDAAAAALVPVAAAGNLGAVAAASSSLSKLTSSSSVSSSGDKALVLLVHCHHGRDRTGLLVGAYKLKHLGFSLADVWKDNRAFGMNLFEAVNSLLWYCLYLEQGLGLTTPRCFDVYAAGIGSPQILTNGQGLMDVPWPPSSLQQHQQQQQHPAELEPPPQPGGILRMGDGGIFQEQQQQQPQQQPQQQQQVQQPQQQQQQQQQPISSEEHLTAAKGGLEGGDSAISSSTHKQHQHQQQQQPASQQPPSQDSASHTFLTNHAAVPLKAAAQQEAQAAAAEEQQLERQEQQQHQK
ncbi:hypothetical protein Esti_004017 [Eimeria stiedai]